VNSLARWVFAFMAALACAAGPVCGGDATAAIEARLIYGTNADPKSAGGAAPELEPRLKRDFGYKHYRVLGERSAKLKEGDGEKLELGQNFDISVKHKGTKKQFHTLGIDLYHQGKWLLFIEVSVKQRSEPIFIKGPWTEDGLLIIALTAK